VILGQLGDRLGRKEVLAFTLMMMALATFGIGALPSGYVIGIWAPILLICLKVVQGFSTGGEYAGATTFVTEYAPTSGAASTRPRSTGARTWATPWVRASSRPSH